MRFYTYEPFGYEGHLCTVEADTRRGIPAIDMVGLGDSITKDTRDLIRQAASNSGLEFPPERVLISVSPADIRKTSPNHSLAVALAIMASKEENPVYSKSEFKYPEDSVLVLGNLELSGDIKPVSAVHAAVQDALSAGITNIICPSALKKEVTASLEEGQTVNILSTDNLADCINKMKSMDNFISYEPALDNTRQFSDSMNITFSENTEQTIGEAFLGKHRDTVRAIEIAVAGKHNLLLVGEPGCGTSTLVQNLIPVITPNLTDKEAMSVARIYSIAGYASPSELNKTVPFRMPHPTATIEGICGGGVNCRPGAISMSHNGVLFLDEAQEFRASCLQLLRVPLDLGSITLSRAGRTTVFPARFQLVMTASPSPDGLYMVPGKKSSDSPHMIDNYWRKFSGPLIDRIGVQSFVYSDDYSDEKSKESISVDELKRHIADAFRIQRKSGTYNQYLSPVQLKEKVGDSFTADMKSFLGNESEKYEFSDRRIAASMKVALTIANLDGREKIQMEDLKEAVGFTRGWFEQAKELNRKVNLERKREKSFELER